jgi:hypothetical protein
MVTGRNKTLSKNNLQKSGLQLQTGFFMGIRSRKSRSDYSLNLLFGLTPKSEKPKLET